MKKGIDYNFIKVILILLVVLGHITTLYGGKAEIFLWVESNKLLDFITDFIYSFHMPFFIFISGAICGICRKKGKYENFLQLIKNKSKRLLLPYLFFGLLLLPPILMIIGNQSNYWHYILNDVFLGKDIRHLWFLLSLFSMFLLIRLIEKLNLKIYIVIIISLILAFVFSHFRIEYFQLGMTFPYFIYFYLGYIFEFNELYTKQIEIKNRNLTCIVALGWIMLCFVIYVKTWGYEIFHFFFGYIMACSIILFVIIQNTKYKIQKFML